MPDEALIQEIVESLKLAMLPVGAIVLYSGEEVPDGWVWCSGSIASIDEFPNLYMIINREFEDGTEKTFRLPKLDSPAPGLRYMIKY